MTFIYKLSELGIHLSRKEINIHSVSELNNKKTPEHLKRLKHVKWYFRNEYRFMSGNYV
jgi:hypothetical protein